jgi:hypothetical protein
MEEDMKKIQMEVIPEPEPGTASVLVLIRMGRMQSSVESVILTMCVGYAAM